MRILLTWLALFALIGAACSNGDDGATAPSSSVPPPGAPADTTPSTAGSATSGAIDTSVDAGLDEVDTDAAWPDGSPALPTGAVGFSRYVYADIGGDILPFLLEGPAGEQVRCQDVELPCSYLELKDLAASGDPIPAELAMSPEELDRLVAQLDELSAALVALESIDDACAAGYEPYTTQWPNMGIHLRNAAHVDDQILDPSRPDVVMFARPDGENLALDELGTCIDGSWTGADDFEVVGSAFYLPLAAEHPEGWAGPLDNWHVHYNSCGGSQVSGVNPVSREECTEDGGRFFTVDPQWMVHAYAVPDADNQMGVFSMWNPSVSPVVDTADLEQSRAQLDVEGAVTWSINDFRVGDLEAGVGQPVVFGNSDATPHTVTSFEPDVFDSGTFGSGGAFTLTFDQPGQYDYFCSLHPSMTGTITVTG